MTTGINEKNALRYTKMWKDVPECSCTQQLAQVYRRHADVEDITNTASDTMPVLGVCVPVISMVIWMQAFCLSSHSSLICQDDAALLAAHMMAFQTPISDGHDWSVDVELIRGS